MEHKKKEKYIDVGSSATLIITLILFIVALFEKGLTHEMLLEAGVFLVSIKLVLAAQKNKVDNSRIEKKLNSIIDHFKIKN